MKKIFVLNSEKSISSSWKEQMLESTWEFLGKLRNPVLEHKEVLGYVIFNNNT